jgi:type II secretory pathway pseudopilin PulG
MTLIEVIVAMAILVGVLLGLGIFSGKFAHATTDARLMGTANELVAARLDSARMQGKYTSIDALASTETALQGGQNGGFTRQTVIQRVGGQPTDSVDYKIVTVIVSHKALSQPVRKTTLIAAY